MEFPWVSWPTTFSVSSNLVGKVEMEARGWRRKGTFARRVDRMDRPIAAVLGSVSCVLAGFRRAIGKIEVQMGGKTKV